MNRKINLLAEDFLKLERELYFVAKDTNIIFKIDLDTEEIEFVDCLPDENIYERNLCYKILKWKNELVFIPMNAKKIWKYDVKNGKWHGIGLGKYEKLKNKSFQAFIYERNLFMIGCGYSVIFQIDLVTEEVVIIDGPFKHLISTKASCSTVFFRYNYVQKGERIFIASCQDNSVMEFNLYSKEVLFHKIGNENNKYSGIAWDGKNFWVSPLYKTFIVKWDGKTDVEEYALPYDEIEEEIGFSGIINTKYGLMIYGKKFFSILLSNNEQKINMHVIPKTYMFLKKEANSIFSLDVCGNLVIESDNKKITIQMSVEKNKLKNFQLEKVENYEAYSMKPEKESVFFDMKDMINNIPKTRSEYGVLNNDTGFNIWNVLNNKYNDFLTAK